MAASIVKKIVCLLPLFLTFILNIPAPPRARNNIPVTRALEPGVLIRKEPAPAPWLSDLDQFIFSVENGQAGQLVGVYVPLTLSLPVVQQPSGQPVYVSERPGIVTQFGMAAQYGTIGLLAHNTLAGSEFYKLKKGQQVVLVYGDGKTRSYAITAVRHFQALQPNSPYSDFVSLEGDSQKITSADLFSQMYSQGNQLVFQTCIDQNGNSSWGRLFITATPLDRQDGFFAFPVFNGINLN